jgi:hypothetical protein
VSCAFGADHGKKLADLTEYGPTCTAASFVHLAHTLQQSSVVCADLLVSIIEQPQESIMSLGNIDLASLLVVAHTMFPMEPARYIASPHPIQACSLYPVANSPHSLYPPKLLFDLPSLQTSGWVTSLAGTTPTLPLNPVYDPAGHHGLHSHQQSKPCCQEHAFIKFAFL